MAKTEYREAMREEAARRVFGLFANAVRPSLEFQPYHVAYYRVLQMFAQGRIRRLIVTMPPQHGKSEGSTRLLPAYMLGITPDAKIAVASYSDTFAKKFNRDVQRIVDTPLYARLFPNTTLNRSNVVTVATSFLRNSSEFEIVNHKGGLKAVGRGGGLTGNTVDVMIMDDLYKDAAEGNSPIIRDASWEWYTSVVKTRLHNDSQQLIVFTRWHEDDVIGRIERSEKVIEVHAWKDLADVPQGAWVKVNFPALQDASPSEIDPREKGTPLWASRHSEEELLSVRKLSPVQFECLYQGNPTTREGLLYGDFKTYSTLPATLSAVKAYVDTADTGEDYTVAIAYAVGSDGYCYVLDVLYSAEPMEMTEPATALLLTRNDVRLAMIESNNGGRGFARNVQRLAPHVRVESFTQRGNKESRVLTNSATVTHNILMPADWRLRWGAFHNDVTMFKRKFAANRHDDAADVLTGIAEKEYQQKNRKTVFV